MKQNLFQSRRRIEKRYEDAIKGIMGLMKCKLNGVSRGNIVRYNKYKNWLAIGNNGGLWTFYAPKYGNRQFLDDLRSAIKHGGKK